MPATILRPTFRGDDHMERKRMAPDHTPHDSNGQEHDRHDGVFMGIGLLLAIIGIGLSYYALTHHLAVKFGDAGSFACNINDALSCDQVAQSAYSEIFGIPLGVYGMGFFGAMLILLLTSFFKEDANRDTLPFYKALAIVGAVISVVLFAISQFSVGALCPTCLGIYLVCFAQLGLVLWRKGIFPTQYAKENFYNGATYAAVVLALVVGAYQFFKPTSHDNPNQAAQTPGGQGDSAASEAKADPAQMVAGKVHTIPLSKSAYAGLGEDYRSGNDEAKVVIQEFADFQCPACAKAAQSVQLLKKDYGDRILVVFRNYPLDKACNAAIKGDFHQFACDAAVLTRCAGREGKFWPLHDLIFANQEAIDAKALESMAKTVGLSDAAIAECRSSKDIMAKIKDDIKLGDKLSVSATPSLFINGQLFIPSPSYENLRYYIDSLLDQ